MIKTYLKVVFEKGVTVGECVKLVETLQESAMIKDIEVYMEVDDKICQRNIERCLREINGEVH